MTEKNEVKSLLIGAVLGIIATGVPALYEHSSYIKESEPSALSIRDVNNDGIKDIVVSSKNSTYLFLGTTNGNFIPYHQYRINLEGNLKANLLQIEENALRGKK